jgi:UDP-3-O-[3-hydroxymyristoyl] glucosamine N-acyltransferase
MATLGELANLVGGKLSGDPTLPIQGAATMDAVRVGEITFADSAERIKRLLESSAAAAVVRKGETTAIPSIQVGDVHAAFAAIVRHFRPERGSNAKHGISPRAIVSPSARIGDDVDVHPFAVIGDDVEIGRGSVIHSSAVIMRGARIGEHVTVFPRVVLYENTCVGHRCLIHAGAVLGAYGFGYSSQSGRHEISAQLGWVEIEDDVEIGANTTIDRGTYGATRIGAGTKIDNLVMVAHNCQIGRHNILCSQVGVAGSTTTGDQVVMGGQVGVRDHVHIGAGAQIGAQAGVTNDVHAGEQMLGSPATTLRQARLQFAATAKLPEMRREFKALARLVEELKSELERQRDSTDPPARAA